MAHSSNLDQCKIYFDGIPELGVETIGQIIWSQISTPRSGKTLTLDGWKVGWNEAREAQELGQQSNDTSANSRAAAGEGGAECGKTRAQRQYGCTIRSGVPWCWYAATVGGGERVGSHDRHRLGTGVVLWVLGTGMCDIKLGLV